jgi:hypothetical protein
MDSPEFVMFKVGPPVTPLMEPVDADTPPFAEILISVPQGNAVEDVQVKYISETPVTPPQFVMPGS